LFQSADKLVLVSYNILGVENASRHPDLYCNIPWKYMDWDYRKACIHRELIKYDPSILCFQVSPVFLVFPSAHMLFGSEIKMACFLQVEDLHTG